MLRNLGSFILFWTLLTTSAAYSRYLLFVAIEKMDNEKKGEEKQNGSGSNKKIRLNKIFVKNLSENTTTKISFIIQALIQFFEFLLFVNPNLFC